MRDEERPLAPRGKQASCAMGEYMRRAGMMPDHVLCSPSQRTRQTWEYWQEGWSNKVRVDYIDRLYLATPKEIFNQLRKLPEEAQSVMVIGHNPGMHQFSLMLVDNSDATARNEMELSFPTAALASFQCSESWRNLGPGQGKLKAFLQPKKLFADAE